MEKKLYYLEHLFGNFLEPNDIIDHFQGTRIFERDGMLIRGIDGTDDMSRRQRVKLFLQWFENYDSADGNKYQELGDVLNNQGYKWLMPLLEDHALFDEDAMRRLERLQKPQKLKQIFCLLFPILKDICVEDVMNHMRRVLNDEDREEISKVIEKHANSRAVYVLLCKLIYKPPDWIQAFIEAIDELNYNATNEMIRDTNYATLADALRDFFDCWTSEALVEAMEYEEAPEPMLQEPCVVRYANHNLNNFNETPAKHLVQDDEFTSCKASDEKINAMEEQMDPCTDELSQKLRSYQKELSKLALTSDRPNVVICERTGSGKTMVAAHIIDQHLKDHGNGKVAFFCPNGGLAEQQHRKMCHYMPERSQNKAIAVMRGNMENEFSKDFAKLITSSEIIIMTPQMLLNHIQKTNRQAISDFTMMVFDECHHARASHPYCEILKKYHEGMSGTTQRGNKSRQEEQIQIIGLTATLGIGSASNEEDAENNIFKLLGILDAKGGIVSVRDKDNVDELNEICPPAEEETCFINTDGDDDGNDQFRKMIKEAARNVIEFLHKIKATEHFEVKVSVGCIHSLKKDFEGSCQKLRVAAEAHIDDQTKVDHEVKFPTLGRDTKSCADTLLQLKRAFDLCHNCQPSDAIREIEKFIRKQYEEHQEKNTEVEHNIHQVLKDLLNELEKLAEDAKNKMLDIIEDKIRCTHEDGPDFRCMIMVPRRLYAAYLVNWVEESKVLKELGGKIYIGIGSTSQSEYPGLTHKKQKEILDGFEKGMYKVLVCTPDAAGEGIDIALCNLVIAVDCVKDEIRRIQLCGRGRKPNSKVLYIYFGSEEEKYASLPLRKQQLMNRVTRKIIRMHTQDPQTFRNKLEKGKRQATGELAAAEEKKRNTPGSVSGRRDSFLCRKCSIYICRTDQLIRVNGNHRTVKDLGFRKMYDRSRHDSMGDFCGPTNMRHVNRIQCAACKYDWGNEVTWKKHLIPIIGIKGFKIKDVRGKTHIPRTWKNSRLMIPEQSYDRQCFDELFEKCESMEE